MNELTFLDIAILKKVDAESSVEKFGSIINTSFFETANLLGTVKIKGYINIESSVGGISRVTMTDAGNSILSVADARSKEPIEPLDNAMLHAVAGGSRELDSLQQSLGIRSADLAYHINKLVSQGFMDYEVKSAKVYFVLTEMGFNATGGVRVQQKLAAPAQGQAQPSSDDEIAGQVASKKDGKPSSPPWVKPEGEKPKKEEKPDVAHIIKDEHLAHKKAEKEKERPKRPLTPEEEAQQRKMKRLTSKAEYYVTEYAPYLLMIVIVALIFVAAIFFALTKLG